MFGFLQDGLVGALCPYISTRPAEWETYKTRMEGKFPLLKQLGREVVLNATDYP